MTPFRRSGFILSIAFILLLELGCGDQYRPVANPIIGPGGQPQTTHFAYVVTNNPAGNGSSIVIDVSGDSTTSLQTMGLGSIYEATNNSGGLLFIANRDNDSVSETARSSAGTLPPSTCWPDRAPWR